jgi:uncharacterized protein
VALPLLDTNVVLRHLLQDHPDHSPRATALFARIRAGELAAHISGTVLTETIFTLERAYKIGKPAICDAVFALLSEPNLVLSGKDRWRRVLDIYLDSRVSLGDAQQLELMEHMGLSEIISFDADFDRLDGVTRIEP